LIHFKKYFPELKEQIKMEWGFILDVHAATVSNGITIKNP